MKRFFLPLGLFVILAFSLLACQTIRALPSIRLSMGTPAPLPVQQAVPAAPVAVPAADLVSLQDTLIKIYEQANPGVVALRVVTPEGDSIGSGFVFDLKGNVITNYHVVEGVQNLEVAFPSGYKAHGKVIGTDLDSDIAVIKVDAPAEELHPLKLGDSDPVKVGQAVVAIGNPFQFNGTMTMGIVSGVGRTMESFHNAPDGGNFSAGDIIQTDTAINPGNSGGPLLNLNGEVIGINRAIYTTNFSSSGQPVNSGIGFAISINIVKRVAPELISSGKFDYPYVGITSISDLSLEDQEALGLPRSAGVYIINVAPGGPAENAGLKAANQQTNIPGLQAGGDLIIGVDDQKVLTYGDFIGYIIEHKKPNDKVMLTVLRNGQEIQAELTLGKRP